MRGLLRFAGAAALAGFAVAAAAQGQFIQSPPLAQAVTTAVGAVAPGPVQVPIITWGGDIATVLANGNAKATSKTSIFGKLGLNLRLAREDVFAKQLEAYLSGRSPYLRGTLGMVNMAIEAAGRDPRTKPVVIYQLTWSAGGDALVVQQRGQRDDLAAIAINHGVVLEAQSRALAELRARQRWVLRARDAGDAVGWQADRTGANRLGRIARHSGRGIPGHRVGPSGPLVRRGGCAGADRLRGANLGYPAPDSIRESGV